MAKQLVLLTYTPRELDEEEYAQFIREIDYPAFRQNPHIIDYCCWRVAESVQGREQFTHFDLMAVDDLANWPAILADPAVPGQHRALDEGLVEARARPPGPVREPQDLLLRTLLGLTGSPAPSPP